VNAPADLRSASATVARPSDRRALAVARRWLLVLAATAALWLLPSLLDTRSIAQLSRFVLFGVAALGLDLLWGRAGLLSFGHAALFGLGCYASGVVLTRTTWAGNDAVAVLAGVAVPAAFGFVAGLVLFKGRIKGVYFGIVTLLFALLFEQLAGTWGGLTGGFNGLVVPGGLTFGPLSLQTPSEMYRGVLVVSILAYVLVRWFAASPIGRAIEAARMNDVRAESLGYDVAVLQAITLGIAGALAGLAGAFYAPLEGFIYPNQLGLVASTSFIVWVAIGGRGSLIGAFVGAVVVNEVQSELSDRFQEYWPLLIGCFVVVVILFAPAGVAGAVRRLGTAHGSMQRWLRARG
jgi:urea transport system permease protein